MSEMEASSPPAMPEDTPTAHPTTGGKSLAALERPRYKSWRKKYRKLHAKFAATYEDNRSLFKEEQRLEAIAKRLREEIDGLLELCLDLNQNPSIPPELRFDVSIPDPPPRVSTGDKYIPANITPEEANASFVEYNHAMRQGTIPPLDVVEVRSQIDAKLAAQGTEPLGTLERRVNRPVGSRSDTDVDQDLGFLPFDQETDYLARLDAKLSMDGRLPADPRHRDVEQEKHYADLTPRESERKADFENPQSQHNWLKTHTKVLAGADGDRDGDDTESLASHDPGSGKPSHKRKSGAGKGSLAKQVGDRAVERAREGSTAFSNDEDELASDAGQARGLASAGASASGKKRARDPDGTYRLKGAKSAGRGKRKRSGDDLPPGGGGGAVGKKARVEGAEGGGDGGGTPGAREGGDVGAPVL